MNENDFNGLSYKDRQLGDQINQVLNEYNSIARKITESKKDYITNNNFTNSYKFYQKNNLKSPFISRKMVNHNPLLRNYNNNISIKRNNETFFGTNDLIEEFKDTLEKSQIIKDDLLKSHRNSARKKRNNPKKNSFCTKTPITYKRNYLKNNGFISSRLNDYEIDNNLSSFEN